MSGSSPRPPRPRRANPAARPERRADGRSPGRDARPWHDDGDAAGGRAALLARIAALEEDRERIFTEAQRAGDVMFARYQLSQLLATGDSLARMADGVIAELATTSGAAAGALWMADPSDSALGLLATVGVPTTTDGTAAGARGADVEPPARFRDLDVAIAWARDVGWVGVALEEMRTTGARGGIRRLAVGFVALGPGPAGHLHPDHADYLSLVRHELATALRAAQFREALANERGVLSAILDGAGDAIVAVDPERRIVRLNEAARRLLGAGRAAAVGRTCAEFLACGGTADGGAGPARCGARCPFEEVLATGVPIVNREQTVPVDGLDEVPVAASFSRMPGPGAGAVAVLRDLRATRALDELKSSFVAGVSHELRTPLALMAGYTQSLLHLDVGEADRRRYLERIEATIGRLTELVNQIIDIAHLESDRLALQRTSVSVESLLSGLATELGELAGMRGIRFACAADLPPVDIDPTRIRQVLANLVMNALKYGGPAVSVTVRARLGDGEVVVSVEDDGPGIEPAERALIFERFYRGRSVRESRIPGSGLGLYLCRRLVEAHGTWIRLDEREAGTSVSFALPAAQPGLPADATTSPARDAVAAARSAAGRR